MQLPHIMRSFARSDGVPVIQPPIIACDTINSLDPVTWPYRLSALVTPTAFPANTCKVHHTALSTFAAATAPYSGAYTSPGPSGSPALTRGRGRPPCAHGTGAARPQPMQIATEPPVPHAPHSCIRLPYFQPLRRRQRRTQGHTQAPGPAAAQRCPGVHCTLPLQTDTAPH